MPKSVPAGISSMIQGNVMTVAMCWEITSRVTNETRRFTAHSRDLRIGSDVYLSNHGFSPSEITTTLNLAVDNLDVEGFLVSTGFTRNEILSGQWDFSSVRIFEVDYTDPNGGEVQLRKGWSGQVQLTNNTFQSEVRGITERLRTKFLRIYQPMCDFDLGSSVNTADCRVRLDPPTWTATTAMTVRNPREAESGSVVKPTTQNGRHFKCTVAGTTGGSEPIWNTTIGGTTVDGSVTWEAIQALTLDGTVTAVTSARQFTDSSRVEATGFWQFGKLTWLTGANAGKQIEVKSSTSGGVIELAEQMFFSIQVGDTYTIHAGCDKSLANHCRDKFDNSDNYGGFPYVPQKQEISATSL